MTLDSTRFQAGLRGATQMATSAGQAIKTAFVPAAAVFAGFAASIVKSSAEMSGMLDLARKSGSGFRDFQRISQAFKESGVSAEKFGAVMPKIIKSIGEAQDGTATYADAFNQLNINIDELASHSPTEQILAMADAWNASTKSAQDFNAMTIIMGRSAADMRQALDMGRAGIEAVGDSVATVSEHSVERIKAAEAALIKFKQNRDVWLAEFGADSVDVLSGLTGRNTAALFKEKGLKGLVSGQYLPFGDLASAVSADFSGSQSGIPQGQALRANQNTLTSLRQILGGAIGQYNTSGDHAEQLRLSGSIDELRNQIFQLANTIAGQGGSNPSMDPIFEH